MKRIVWRKVLITLASLALASYLLFTIVRTKTIDQELLCKGINVEIKNSKLQFVRTDDVLAIIKQSGIPVQNAVLYQIPLDKLMTLLESKSYIMNVNVFVTGNGFLNVQLEQREPVVRIAPTGMAPFYMDQSGFVFPVSPVFTFDVPIVTGYVPLPFTMPFKGNLPKLKKADYLLKLIDFAQYVKKSEFWNAQITQIDIDKKEQVVLTTCTGNFEIMLGSLDQYEYKLRKLFSFFNNALPVEGWSKYKKIDLRFNKQVVATIKSEN